MKRILLGICVAMLVVGTGGLALAVETSNYTVPPNASKYNSALSGAAGVTVGGWEDAIAVLGTDGKNQLAQALQKLESAGANSNEKLSMALVKFTLPTSGVKYAWAEKEYLYNFQADRFYNDNDSPANILSTVSAASVEAKASKEHTFISGSDYLKTEGTNASLISVKETTSGGSGGGGCSVLTLGAAALFMLPVLALKRGKK